MANSRVTLKYKNECGNVEQHVNQSSQQKQTFTHGDIMANQLLSALNLIAVLSVSAALPLYRRSENIANHNSTSTSLVDDLLFSPPNCSQITELDYDQSNRTHIDFRIGLNQLKKYLKDVRVSNPTLQSHAESCMHRYKHDTAASACTS